MPGNLLVELNPATVNIDADGGQVDLLVSIQNLGDVVDQYIVEIAGLDSDWFTPPPNVGLFPQDREQVRVSLHPPSAALRKGNYPFKVLVRSRGGAATESADAVLEIRGAGRLSIELKPPKQTARGWAAFKVQLANTGNADVQAALEGRDAEEACELRFPHDQAVVVPADGRVAVDLRVRPRKRPWVGPERPYSFSVTARPQIGGSAPQTAPGQFVYRPWLPSWAPLRTAALVVVGLAVVLVVASVLVSAGVVEQFPTRFEVALGVIRGGICRVPALGGLCPADSVAAHPVLDPNCSYAPPMKDYADAETSLIGVCQSSVGYDGFGNAMQYSSKGVLFWQKDSNTVYFFADTSVYAFVQGKSAVLHGP